MLRIFFITVLLSVFQAFGSRDSLLLQWNNSDLADSSRMKVMEQLLWEHYIFSQPDTAFILAEELYSFARDSKDLIYQAKARNIQGITYYMRSELDSAEYYYTESSLIHQQANNKQGIANTLGNLGLVKKIKGDIVGALDAYYGALHMLEQLEDKGGVALVLNNIANILRNQGEIEKARGLFLRSLDLNTEIDEEYGIILNLQNLGGLFYDERNLDSAMHYYERALELEEQYDDEKNAIITLNSIGQIYQVRGNHVKAMEYFDLAMEKAIGFGDKQNLAASHVHIGDSYIQQDRLNEAIKHYSTAYELSTELGEVRSVELASVALYNAYKSKGDSKKALLYFEKYIEARDSLINIENERAAVEKEFAHEYDRKATEDSLRQAKEIALKNSEIEYERREGDHLRTQRWFLYGGIALAALFAIFMFNRFQVTQKQKAIIEEQKDEVENQKSQIEQQHDELEETHREISDSINYAERLQSAIFPSREEFSSNFSDTMILFHPKDVVSGDFYWMYKSGETVWFAVADCTGHGVPGAMVSVVCSNALNRSVKEFRLSEPAEILNKTREIVIETFGRSGGQVKDGMDIALCRLKGRELVFSGANNPLWIIRKEAVEIEEVKGDKQPIGLHERQTDFTQTELSLDSGDSLVIFSDGYADQFGGPKGKKFKYKNMKSLLLEHQSKPMNEQREELIASFESWQGNLEQVDDVCLIGVRV